MGFLCQSRGSLFMYLMHDPGTKDGNFAVSAHSFSVRSRMKLRCGAISISYKLRPLPLSFPLLKILHSSRTTFERVNWYLPLLAIAYLHFHTITSTMAFNPPPPPKTALGNYRLLAPTASVRVSPLCLGGMNFGNAWKEFMGECDQNTTESILDYFYGQSSARPSTRFLRRKLISNRVRWKLYWYIEQLSGRRVWKVDRGMDGKERQSWPDGYCYKVHNLLPKGPRRQRNHNQYYGKWDKITSFVARKHLEEAKNQLHWSRMSCRGLKNWKLLTL